MRRGGPLKRTKPLRSKTGLKRTPFKRNGKPPKPLKRTPMKAAYKPTGPDRDVVEAVLERANFSCERCGIGLGDRRVDDYQIQHRRPRGNGGTDKPDTNLPPNLLVLDPGCHDHVERVDRAGAERDGFLVSQWADPARQPVRIAGRGWTYLSNSGSYASYPPPKRGDDR